VEPAIDFKIFIERARSSNVIAILDLIRRRVCLFRLAVAPYH